MSEQRSFAAFDIDGTIFRSSLYIEVVYELERRKIIDVDQEVHDAALERWNRREEHGYLDYRDAMVEILESQIIGIDVEEFEAAADSVIEQQANHTYVYTERQLQAARDAGKFLIAISGSQEQLVERFAKHYGFDAWVGQHYGVENGKFNGEITKTHKGKDEILSGLLDRHNLITSESWAVGDTEGDIGMLSMVDRAIAFNPNRKLYLHAVKHGWEVVVERKDMVYKLHPASDGRTIYELIDTE